MTQWQTDMTNRTMTTVRDATYRCRDGGDEMGVDFTAYRDIILLPEDTEEVPDDYDECYEKGYFQPFAYVGFERSTRGFVDHDKVNTEHGWLMYDRWYQHSDGGSHDWGTSYGWYNVWRRDLCITVLEVEPSVVWREDGWEDAPFYELIAFADNEGYIGSEAASDLAVDFEEHQDFYTKKVRKNSPYDWVQKQEIRFYDDFMIGTQIAANNGCIHYH